MIFTNKLFNEFLELARVVDRRFPRLRDVCVGFDEEQAEILRAAFLQIMPHVQLRRKGMRPPLMRGATLAYMQNVTD